MTHHLYEDLSRYCPNGNPWEDPIILLMFAKAMGDELVSVDQLVSEVKETSNTVFYFKKDSYLHDCLTKWFHESEQTLQEGLRAYFEDDEYIYFMTGQGYDVFDCDMLDGIGDGGCSTLFSERYDIDMTMMEKDKLI